MPYYGRSDDHEYDDESPPTHCPGPSIPDHAYPRRCGRFLVAGAWICARCHAETESYWRNDKAEEAAHMQRLVAQEAAHWANWTPAVIAAEDLPF